MILIEDKLQVANQDTQYHNQARQYAAAVCVASPLPLGAVMLSSNMRCLILLLSIEDQFRQAQLFALKNLVFLLQISALKWPKRSIPRKMSEMQLKGKSFNLLAHCESSQIRPQKYLSLHEIASYIGIRGFEVLEPLRSAAFERLLAPPLNFFQQNSSINYNQHFEFEL
ncbi:hypothetical protein FGO68_gene17228 [Halteria grandinella]|uniref:Uncharacterized protein n=1 Tax=Halteria grandinella TaxID=5974 RepID=A0A8J8NK91_HALGN|nr:hypothetical protein FGO68_gene17228 [Halteria grandinella]